MSVMNLDPRTQEDHLRVLLDQRAARADRHGRFPSLSDISDSPSMYSHSRFSPRSQYDGHTPSLHVTVSRRPGPPSEPRSPLSPMSDRERLNFPNASSLDLDDDPRSSYASSDIPDDDDISPEDEPEEDLTRLGVYGPKMRFHSRAPWELGEDEAESPDDIQPKNSKESRKGWGRPKVSMDKRPSTDSNRSQPNGKQSFESFTSNGGALMALAQASMSSTSLGVPPAPHTILRDKLSLPRLRTRTPSNNPHAPGGPETPGARSSPLSAAPMTPAQRYAQMAELSPLDRSHSERSSSSGEYTHPFANPEVVHSAVRRDVVDPYQRGMRSPTLQQNVSRSDSNATVTETTTTSSLFQSGSTATVSMTSGTSLSSVSPDPHECSPPPRFGGLAKKAISGPVYVGKLSPQASPITMTPQQDPSRKMSLASMDTNVRTTAGVPPAAIAGWGENPIGASIKLISLEEAQAQARERSKSATGHPSVASPVSATTKVLDWDQQSTRSRTRTTSVGSKSRSAASDSGLSATRTVARKRSGFMRLFNGKERPGPQSPPPPVPSLSTDTLASANMTAPPLSPGFRKGLHRVPVPSLSPSLLADRDGESGAFADAESNTGTIRRERQLSARRNVPGLSILTSPPTTEENQAVTPPLSVKSDISPHTGYLHTPTTTSTTAGGLLSPSAIPLSAPPAATEFVGLKLRPVSTLFNHISGELISAGRPSLDADTGTPTTATTALTPLSPDFQMVAPASRGEKPLPPALGSPAEDQSAIILALQEQIVSARRAWQREIWELEGQVRDLKMEVDELRAGEANARYCGTCGRGDMGRPGTVEAYGGGEERRVPRGGVVNRPRARTGVGSRFGSTIAG